MAGVIDTNAKRESNLEKSKNDSFESFRFHIMCEWCTEKCVCVCVCDWRLPTVATTKLFLGTLCGIACGLFAAAGCMKVNDRSDVEKRNRAP